MSLPPQNGDDADSDWRCAKYREHRARDRQHLGAVLDADVHVHAVDEHLPAPPLRAVDQRRVALLVGDLLAAPSCANGCVPPPMSSIAQGVGDRADLVQRALQVRRRPRRPSRHLPDRDLDRVEQQLLRDQRVLAAVRRAGRPRGSASAAWRRSPESASTSATSHSMPTVDRSECANGSGDRRGHQSGSTTSTCWLPATRVRMIVALRAASQVELAPKLLRARPRCRAS